MSIPIDDRSPSFDVWMKKAEASAQDTSEKGVVMVQRSVRRWTASLAVVLLGALLWSSPSRAWPTDATTFSGQATGVLASALWITAVLSGSWSLPPSGGAREASLLARS